MKEYNNITTYEAYKLGYKKGYEEGKNSIKDILCLCAFGVAMWLVLICIGVM